MEFLSLNMVILNTKSEKSKRFPIFPKLFKVKQTLSIKFNF